MTFTPSLVSKDIAAPETGPLGQKESVHLALRELVSAPAVELKGTGKTEEQDNKVEGKQKVRFLKVLSYVRKESNETLVACSDDVGWAFLSHYGAHKYNCNFPPQEGEEVQQQEVRAARF